MIDAFSQALEGLEGRAVRIGRQIGLIDGLSLRVHVDLHALSIDPSGARRSPLPKDVALPITEAEYRASIAELSGSKVVRVRIQAPSRRREPHGALFYELQRLLPEAETPQLHYLLYGGTPIRDVPRDAAEEFAERAGEYGVKVTLDEERTLSVEDVPAVAPPPTEPRKWTAPSVAAPDALHAHDALETLVVGACALVPGMPAATRFSVGRVFKSKKGALRLRLPKGATQHFVGERPATPRTERAVAPVFLVDPEEADFFFHLMPLLGASYRDLLARAQRCRREPPRWFGRPQFFGAPPPELVGPIGPNGMDPVGVAPRPVLGDVPF